MAGCGSDSNDNVLDGNSVNVQHAEPAQKDVSVPVGKQQHDLALQEPDIAIATEKCSEIDKELRKDWCFQDIAKKADSADTAKEICSMISETSLKDDCLSSSAKRLGDITLCDSVSDAESKVLCKASSAGDCSQIEDEQEREHCEQA